MATIVDVNRVVTTNLSVTGVSTFVDVDTSTINGINYPNAGPLSNRNLINNGDMRIAQRGTQVTSVTTTGYRTCDRFYISVVNLGTWTVDQSTDAPEGFSNSFKLTCTTADASPVLNNNTYVVQKLEGQDLQHLKFGTANALPLVVSFWVKSNKTGVASLDVRQPDISNRLFSQGYTINAANTWEYKTISIPADTAGQIDNDNGNGLSVGWWLNSGPDLTGGSYQTSWGSLVETNRNVSNLGVGGAISDYFAITGVQLEVGTVATPFEHRSYGDELVRCCRYYQKSYNQGVAPGTTTNDGSVGNRVDGSSAVVHHQGTVFRHTMRANPTVTLYSPENGVADRVSDRGSNLTSHVNNGTVSSIFGAAHNGFTSIVLAASEGPAITYHYTADAEL